MDVLPLRSVDSLRPDSRPNAPLPNAPLRPKENFAGLDVVRGLAALGVVLLHAGVPYLEHPMPGLAWPIRDTASSLVDVIFWTIELFIMPLFLVLAGFFAWRTLDRRGAAALLKTRARRLLVPLLFGAVVVLPLDLYAWVLGWVAEGIVAPVKLKSLKFDAGIDRDLWGLSHLWFLLYLFLYVAVVALCSRVADRYVALKRWTPPTSVVVTSLFVIAAMTLYVRPEVVWGFQHAFAPVPSKWIYSGTFFVGGLLIAAQDQNLDWVRSITPRLLVPAALLSIAAVTLGRWHLSGEQTELASLVLASVTVLSAAGITLSIIGLAIRYIHRVPVAVSYLAAASFWIYLMHHPILGIVHLDLKWLLPEVSAMPKLAIAFILSAACSLLTYEGFVRKTRLGRWLGFAWSPPKEDRVVRASESLAGRVETAAVVSPRRAA